MSMEPPILSSTILIQTKKKNHMKRYWRKVVANTCWKALAPPILSSSMIIRPKSYEIKADESALEVATIFFLQQGIDSGRIL
mmetsp:Transcript_35953/g.61338  ORF Transcript_35953/g.61338 Transcript_35953/m.61338 type:complete len:82 (+) Transcript_35953:569-814(+)